ncbi:hypothetical protein [Actinophytocola sp. NPDC049390]
MSDSPAAVTPIFDELVAELGQPDQPVREPQPERAAPRDGSSD